MWWFIAMFGFRAFFIFMFFVFDSEKWVKFLTGRAIVSLYKGRFVWSYLDTFTMKPFLTLITCSKTPDALLNLYLKSPLHRSYPISALPVSSGWPGQYHVVWLVYSFQHYYIQLSDLILTSLMSKLDMTRKNVKINTTTYSHHKRLRIGRSTNTISLFATHFDFIDLLG